MWFLIITLSCRLLKVSGEYKLENNAGTWTEANKMCELARPVINWSDQKNPVVMDVNVKSKVTDEAWIGYAKSYHIFQYIGCVDITSFTINYTVEKTLLGPGHCFHACNTSKMFGLRTTEREPSCFCLESGIGDIIQTRNECTKRCNNDRFLCGNTTYISVYAKVQIEGVNTTDEEKCLRYKARKNEYNWQNCNQENHVLCFTDVNDNNQGFDEEKFGWEDAMNDCYHKNQFPKNKSHYNQSLGKGYWTPYINAVTFDSKDTSEIKTFGYIKRTNNILKLKFTTNPDETKRALCQIEASTPASTTTTTTVTTTTQGTITSNAGLTTEHTTTPHKPITFPSTSFDETTSSYVSGSTHTDQPVNTLGETNLHQESDAQKSGDSKTGIYVSIPLVILACVCVAVACLIWYRKRNRQKQADPNLLTRSNRCYEGSNYDEIDENMTNEKYGKQTKGKCEDPFGIPNTLGDQHYESIDKDIPEARIYDFALETNDVAANKNTAEPSYFVLEKVEKPQDVSQDDELTTPGSISDHTDTVYNIATHGTDADNYDHVERKKLNVVDDRHYDTTFSTLESEPHYDTTNQSKTGSGEQDDTYNSTK